jgi:ABC-type glycerol-3-phosphate transport system substrate-binding protein
MTDLKRSLNRRTFLGAAAAAAGAAALAACGNPNPQPPAVAGKPTEAPKAAAAAPTSAPAAAAPAATKPAAAAAPTTAPAAAAGATPAAAAKPGAAPKEIFTMVDKTWSDLGMKAATEQFNKEHGPTLGTVVLEETAQGWDTKVLQQIRDNNLRWSGHGYAPFFDSHKYIKGGLVAPIDDYLKSSKIAWGQKQQDAYFTKRIYDALLLDGKQYYIPMKANVHLVGYRQDVVQSAGYEVFPKTWDEVDKMIAKLKPELEKQDMVAMGISRDMFRTLGTAFTTFIEKPFDDDGVLKFESPEWFQWMELVKKWQDMKMVRVDGPEHSDAWQKGKFVFSLGSHSQVRLGRGVHGPKVNGAPPPQPNTTQPPRTWIHIDSGFVFPNAPNPQLATDWLLSILGPDGAPAEAWWKTVVTFSGQPVHQPMVEKALKDNQSLKEVWEIMQLVPNSQIITLPVAGAYAIVQAKIWPHIDNYLAGKGSLKDEMAATRKEVNEELAKIKK